MLMESKIAALHAEAHSMAFECYLRKGRVPVELTQVLYRLEQLFDEVQGTGFKYDPDQPRVPAGNPDGGQWTDAGGGNGGEVEKPEKPSDENTISDEDKAKIIAVSVAIAVLAFVEVTVVAGLVIGAGRVAINVGRGAISRYKILRAKNAIERYFGGKPERTFRNPKEDLIMMSKDKKIRFDINNYSRHDEPHFHIQELNKDGKWISVVKQHANPFRKE